MWLGQEFTLDKTNAELDLSINNNQKIWQRG